MIVVFVVDSTASMNQKCTNGLTLLDCAKSAVEHVIKMRSRDPTSRNDRYLLVTSDEAVKVSWKDNPGVLMELVKGIEACGLCSLNSCIVRAFELLNRFRFQTGIDNFGQGLCPWFSCNEPGLVALISDGDQGSTDTIQFPAPNSLGGDLISDFWRWDQRLCAFITAMPGVGSSINATAPPALRNLCERTGGKCTVTSSLRQLLSAVEGCVVKQAHVGPYVTVNFELRQTEENDELRSLDVGASSERRMLLVRSNKGFWPVPEAQLPASDSSALAARPAHPTITVLQVNSELQLPDGFNTYDKYEVEQGGLVSSLLAARPGTTWKCFVRNSCGDGALGKPFGCLRADKGVVFLWVLPYNYPVLFGLLKQLAQQNNNPSPQWTQQLRQYALKLPNYYLRHLRDALKHSPVTQMINLSQLIQKNGDLSPMVSSYLMKLRNQSRIEGETQDKAETEAAAAKKKAAEAAAKPMDAVVNVFDIERSNLLAEMGQLQAQVCWDAPIVNQSRFCVPIDKMGLYQESLAQQEVIRNPILNDKENQEALQPTFGNPYKKLGSSKANSQTDETFDEAAFGLGRSPSRSGSPSRKRSMSPGRPDSPKRPKESPTPPVVAPPPRVAPPSAPPPNRPTPPPRAPPPRKSPTTEKRPAPPPPAPPRPAAPPQPAAPKAKPAPPAPPAKPPPPSRPSPPVRPPPSRPSPPVPPPGQASAELKLFAVQQMRKPGKDFEPIMKRLADFKGVSKPALLQELIQQARNYKKDALVALLEAEADP